VRILLDHSVPAPLRDFLRDHTVDTAYEMGWARLENGLLLSSAEAVFDALITSDQNLAISKTSPAGGSRFSSSRPPVGRRSKLTSRTSWQRSIATPIASSQPDARRRRCDPSRLPSRSVQDSANRIFLAAFRSARRLAVLGQVLDAQRFHEFLPVVRCEAEGGMRRRKPHVAANRHHVGRTL
jgi:hypothetical protein